MIKPLTTLVYLRTARPNRDHFCPIYIRITINNKRTDFSTGQKCLPDNWDLKRAKAKSNTPSGKLINAAVNSIIGKIQLISNRIQSNNLPFTIDTFLEEFKGKAPFKRTLVPIIQNHNALLKQLVGIEYAKGTHDRYQTLLMHVKAFMLKQYSIKDIDIEKLNLAFVKDFDFYLRITRGCGNNSTVKYIKNLRKIIRVCLENDWLSHDPFKLYKNKIIAVEKEYLTTVELQKIIDLETEFPRLNMVRDIFLFSCYTGLAYSDVAQLTEKSISKGIDGEDWIHIHRQKTKISAQIPILDIPKKLIAKYKDNIKCINDGTLLPRYSNQLLNNYLKEIAVCAKINKNITFHTARHTFATTVTLSRGVPMETVSKMLGHTSIRTTQVYAKITNSKVSEDMLKLKLKS